MALSIVKRYNTYSTFYPYLFLFYFQLLVTKEGYFWSLDYSASKICLGRYHCPAQWSGTCLDISAQEKPSLQ